MSKRIKVLLIKYGSCAAFVGLLAYLYISLRDFAGEELVEQYRILCDAFTIPGVLLIMFGAMIWALNTGALDGITYAVTFAFRSLIPGGRYRDEKFADYVERRREKRVKGYGFLLISGGAAMAIAMVFYALFYTVF